MRVLRLSLILLALVPGATADSGYHDPEFSRFPFANWLTAPNKQQIHWSVFISPAELSAHQRMILRVTARVDGRELEKRRSAGQFEALIEYADSTGHVWQNHTTIDPKRMHAAMQSSYLDIHFYAFVLPGDYTVSLGVCDPQTFEHSVAIRKVRVNPLKDDPMPNLWAGLPAVDLVPSNSEPPDIWYLPELETRLHLPVETKRPLHVQLLLNTTPSQKAAGSVAAVRDNMSVLIPAMKILSQMQLTNGTIDAAVLDLTHRKVAFDQSNAPVLDWAGIRRFFLDAHPGIVDVHTLEGQRRMLPYFSEEVRKRLAPDTVVIVLSGPAFYEDQEAVDGAQRPVSRDRQLFYVRYRTVSIPRRYPPAFQGPARSGRLPARAMAFPVPDSMIPPMKEDDLEKIAESMNARVFDAASALQFRRILAAMLEQISRM